jgi:hypothetical protein
MAKDEQKPDSIAGVKAQVEKLRALVNDPDFNADSLDAVVKQLGSMSDINLAEVLSEKELTKIAEAQLGEEKLALLREVKKAADGSGGLQGLAGALAGSGLMAEGGTVQSLFTQFGANELDPDQAKNLPGLIVDPSTGKVSILGLIDLDPKDPSSRLLAQAVTVGYNHFLIPLNERLFDWSYKQAGAAATGMNLAEGTRNKVALGAALAATGITAFWPNISGYWRMEGQHQQEMQGLTRQLSPALQQYKNSTTVTDLYRVSPKENEVISNARSRLSTQHRAARAREAVALLERGPTYLYGLMQGTGNQNDLQHAISEKVRGKIGTEAGLTQAEINKWQQVGARAEEIRRAAGNAMPMDEALKFAQKEVFNAAINPEKSGWFGEKFGQKMTEGALTVWALVANNLANKVFNARLEDVSSISALDMIECLKKQLDQDTKQDKFNLPAGMEIEGAKHSADSLPLADYVEQIFLQHERDTRGMDANIPSRLHEKLHRACEQIAAPLRAGTLDGMALIMLVGERHVVRTGGKTIASEDIIGAEIDRLSYQLRHVEWVDDSTYYKESSFTPEQVRESWQAMDVGERALFMHAVPRQALRAAGVDKKQIDDAITHMHSEAESVYSDLAALVSGLVKSEPAALENLGTTRREMNLLKEADTTIHKEGAQAIERYVLQGGIERQEMKHALSNAIVARYTHHMGTLGDLMAKGRE